MKKFMTYKTIAFFALTIFLAGSCKKAKLPQPAEEGAPVFYFRGNVNGVAVDLNAGISDYHMFSTYTQDANNVYHFIGNLKEINTNLNSIQIEFYDRQMSPVGGTSGADSTFLASYNYPILSGTATPVAYMAFFKSIANNGTSSINWNFGDGGTSTLPNPSHTFSTFGKFNVCLSMTDSLSNTSAICQPLKVGIAGDTLRTSISISANTSNTIFFTASTNASGLVNHTWNFGDGTPPLATTATTASHTYTNSGQYFVSLQSVNNNDTARAYYNANTQGNPQFSANQKLVSFTPITNPFAFMNVVIRWTDANGLVYTSDDPSQPASSKFTLLSVENYHNNEENQTVKKLHVQFNCMVYNGTNSIPITNGDAVIVVAYK
jgi:hypothetical protein